LQLRSPELAALYDFIKTLPKEKRASFGQEVNKLKQELQDLVNSSDEGSQKLAKPIDVTAPFDTNVSADKKPKLLPIENASRHPLTSELKIILSIFERIQALCKTA
jgi:phenylalanyl-tRNA synthetase alpha subunit